MTKSEYDIFLVTIADKIMRYHSRISQKELLTDIFNWNAPVYRLKPKKQPCENGQYLLEFDK